MVMNVDVAIAKLTAAWLLKNESPPFGLLRASSGAFSPYRYGRGRPDARVMTDASAVAARPVSAMTTRSLRAGERPSSTRSSAPAPAAMA